MGMPRSKSLLGQAPKLHRPTSGHQQETHWNHLGRWQHHGHVCQHTVAHACWNSDSGVLGRWGVVTGLGQALLYGKILDDILMRLDHMDIVLCESLMRAVIDCACPWHVTCFHLHITEPFGPGLQQKRLERLHLWHGFLILAWRQHFALVARSWFDLSPLGNGQVILSWGISSSQCGGWSGQ